MPCKFISSKENGFMVKLLSSAGFCVSTNIFSFKKTPVNLLVKQGIQNIQTLHYRFYVIGIMSRHGKGQRGGEGEGLGEGEEL